MDREPTSSSRSQVIDLITVVFQQELYLLEVQARSIELYIEPHRIQNIYVVINDSDAIVSQIDLAWWGVNSHKVKLIPRSLWGDAETLHGWASQQLYKLLAAEQAESAWSMCLDAKTWFVQPLDWSKLFDTNGKACFKSFPTIPVFKSAQLFVEQYLGIKLPHVIGPGGVPFMFHTETVKSMVKHIDNFFDFFVAHVQFPDELTEFMLYSGFVIYKYGNYTRLYSKEQFYTVTNLADWQHTEFDHILQYMGSEHNLTASIQGRAYAYLTPEQLDCWTGFLLTKQLIASPENTKNKLNIFR